MLRVLAFLLKADRAGFRSRKRIRGFLTGGGVSKAPAISKGFGATAIESLYCHPLATLGFEGGAPGLPAGIDMNPQKLKCLMCERY